VADLRMPTASQSKPQTFRLCQPMTPALPVGERRLRHVPVSWAAVRQDTACHCGSMYRCRVQSTRVGKQLVRGRLVGGREGCADRRYDRNPAGQSYHLASGVRASKLFTVPADGTWRIWSASIGQLPALRLSGVATNLLQIKACPWGTSVAQNLLGTSLAPPTR
jgi:hypothetical protein